MRVLEANIPDRSVVVEWLPSANASGYIVRWTTPNGEQQLETDGNTRQVTLTDLVTDQRAFITIGARNASGTGDLLRATFYIPEFRDIVEALFLATGPYRDDTGTAPLRFGGHLGGWPPGSNVAVRIDRAFTSQQVDNATRFVHEINDLLSGSVRVHIVEVGPLTTSPPVPGEIKVVRVADPGPVCNTIASCARIFGFPSNFALIERGMAVVREDSATRIISHELAHLFGMYHVTLSRDVAWQIGPLRVPGAIMGIPPGFVEEDQTLAPIEAEAFRRVYRAGLRPGASRADFLRLGLIRNP